MERKTPENQKDLVFIKNHAHLNRMYSNPSMLESKTEKENWTYERLSFVVEWQMYNPSSDKIPKPS